MESKEFQGPADIFKAIYRRAGLRCLTERSTTQEKTVRQDYSLFAEVCLPSLHRTHSHLLTFQHCSQSQPVEEGLLRHCQDLHWALETIPGTFPFSSLSTSCCQLLLPTCCCSSALLAPFLACSWIWQLSAIYSHLLKVDFTWKSSLFCDWTQGKAGESPKTSKNPCYPFMELAQRPGSELPQFKICGP